MFRIILKFVPCICFLILSVSVFGQANIGDDNQSDDRYLEDQFYVCVGYNMLLDKPDDVVQRSFSYNLQAGIIKDIPLNKRRNFGIGLGLGYAMNSYFSNMIVTESSNDLVYEVVDVSDFNRSKLGMHTVELPFELRWRTSTANEYKFWRIYAGARFGYVFSARSKLVMEEGTTSFSNPDIESFQYGVTLNFGYNTWNVHAYYGLSTLFKDSVVMESGTPIDVKVLRIGLIFYIL
ncbi:porin family protein [Allomuricauda sp. F6463D]|uniref:porin family protein n=1 Tax=Allomuricauda sp. F6463D TaxID=2926409 RepID=UPI001FF1DD30|nr:porin family protein [Muricauda sp. F6463D]MCK0160783.1 PorT family protein [Muricauda sp. F6463D]